MSLPDFRIVYHASTQSGKPFRVDQRSLGARFVRCGYFSSVPHALAKFPGAEVSSMAREEQERREYRSHGFQESFDGSAMCRFCGKDVGFKAHTSHDTVTAGGAQ